MASPASPIPTTSKIYAYVYKIKIVAGPVSEETVRHLGKAYKMASEGMHMMQQSIGGAVSGATGLFLRRAVGAFAIGGLLSAGPLPMIWDGLAMLMTGLVNRFTAPMLGPIEDAIRVFSGLAKNISDTNMRIRQGIDSDGVSITTVERDLQIAAQTAIESIPDFAETIVVDLPPIAFDFAGIVAQQVIGTVFALIDGLADAATPLDVIFRRQAVHWLARKAIGMLSFVEKSLAKGYQRLYKMAASGADITREYGVISKFLDDVERMAPKVVSEAIEHMRLNTASHIATWSTLLQNALSRVKALVESTKVWGSIAGELAVHYIGKPASLLSNSRLVQGLEMSRLSLANKLTPVQTAFRRAVGMASELAWTVTTGMLFDLKTRAYQIAIGIRLGKEAARQFGMQRTLHRAAMIAARAASKSIAGKAVGKGAARLAGLVPVVGLAIDVGFLAHDVNNVFFGDDVIFSNRGEALSAAASDAGVMALSTGFAAVSVLTAVGAGVGTFFGPGPGTVAGGAAGAIVGVVVGVVAGIATYAFKSWDNTKNGYLPTLEEISMEQARKIHEGAMDKEMITDLVNNAFSDDGFQTYSFKPEDIKLVDKGLKVSVNGIPIHYSLGVKYTTQPKTMDEAIAKGVPISNQVLANQGSITMTPTNTVQPGSPPSGWTPLPSTVTVGPVQGPQPAPSPTFVIPDDFVIRDVERNPMDRYGTAPTRYR